MKTLKITLIMSSLLALIALQGCTPKTAGSDSAYLNKNRGAANAQISREQAEQYHRQQALTSAEIDIENKKRHQTTDAIEEGSSATRSAVGAIDSVRDLLNSF